MKRLYSAVCSLIEAKAGAINATLSEPPQEPEGAYSDTEVSVDYRPDELHVDAYRLAKAVDKQKRRQRIGFTP